MEILEKGSIGGLFIFFSPDDCPMQWRKVTFTPPKGKGQCPLGGLTDLQHLDMSYLRSHLLAITVNSSKSIAHFLSPPGLSWRTRHITFLMESRPTINIPVTTHHRLCHSTIMLPFPFHLVYLITIQIHIHHYTLIQYTVKIPYMWIYRYIHHYIYCDISHTISIFITIPILIAGFLSV